MFIKRFNSFILILIIINLFLISVLYSETENNSNKENEEEDENAVLFPHSLFIEDDPLEGELIFKYEKYKIIRPRTSVLIKDNPWKGVKSEDITKINRKATKIRYFKYWSRSKVKGAGEITKKEFKYQKYESEKLYRAIYDDEDNLLKLGVYKNGVLNHIYRYTHPYYLVITRHEQYEHDNLLFYELMDYDRDGNLLKHEVYKLAQLIYYQINSYNDEEQIRKKIIYQYIYPDESYLTKFGSEWFFLNFAKEIFTSKNKDFDLSTIPKDKVKSLSNSKKGIWIGKEIEFDIYGNIDRIIYFKNALFKLLNTENNHYFILKNPGEILFYTESTFMKGRENEKKFYDKDDNLRLYWKRTLNLPIEVARLSLDYYENQTSESTIKYYNENNDKLSFSDFRKDFTKAFSLKTLFNSLSDPTIGEKSYQQLIEDEKKEDEKTEEIIDKKDTDETLKEKDSSKEDEIDTKDKTDNENELKKESDIKDKTDNEDEPKKESDIKDKTGKIK